LRAQDAKIVADNLEYSREFYSGVHFSAIAESQPSFGYQRYPDNGPAGAKEDLKRAGELDPELKEEIGHIMDSVHRMSEKEVEKIEKE
jgi:hypothetical protein